MAMELRDWLWRLNAIQDETQKIAAHVHSMFSIGLQLQPSANAEFETFPHGELLSCFKVLAGKYVDGETGELWVDVGTELFPFVFCWEDFSVHKSVPEKLIPPVSASRDYLDWKRWLFIDREHTQAITKRDQVSLISRIEDLFLAAGEACNLAPQPVLDKLGNFALLDWPTALFYLALKRVHPLLTAWGHYAYKKPKIENLGVGIRVASTKTPNQRRRRQSQEDAFARESSYGDLNDYEITFSPSNIPTATAYAFDVLRQIATGSNVSPLERTTDSKPDTPKKSLPDSPDVRDLCRLLQKGLASGHTQSEIACEFTKEMPGNDKKAQSLLRQARRFSHLWKPADK